uniref:protein SOB FIVE-LIKE 5-like n=1 Tax=Erigeron canadensis TaxID=72917 RepID=UPI001CB97A9A|nr:protein SOB FIVE-LIKE 5-like [Erigeron canadensis]XP_043607757.1 protein SOB FIVE-LIKE 5-like [Erigeron canadensis]
MNMSTSECTSGCESGWTMYLDQSVNSGYDEKCEKGSGHGDGKWPYVSMEQDEEDEDDLSMVSDASSGPRQKFDEDDQENIYVFDYASQSKTNKERSKGRLNEKKTSNDVDDTASSTYISKAKSGLLKKVSSVAKKCVPNKSGEMRKGSDYFGAQGSRELGSARKN